MSWVGLDEEIDGVRKAVRNLEGDAAQIAAYVYDRMSDYRGAEHPSVCRLLLAEMVESVKAQERELP